MSFLNKIKANLHASSGGILESSSKMLSMKFTNLALYYDGGIAEILGPNATLFATYSNFFFVLGLLTKKLL